MSHRRSMVLICSMIIIGWRLMADVPPPRLHKPDIPYFLQSLRFETTQMRIFPTQVSGMVINLYSDLHWNPAFVLNQREKSVYLDFNSEVEQPSFIIPILTPYSNYGEYSASKLILPRWYPTTSVNSVDTTPIYDVAALLAVSRRISLGFINRSIFDYGPFRSAMGWMGSLLEASFVPVSIPSNLEPQRLEVGNNQQTVLGTQSEMLVGYRLSKRIDLGLRLGHAVFDRDGALYDSKWATYPHSSFADLEDESLDVGGDQLEAGVGAIYRLNKKTRLGIYGGMIGGDGSEELASLDSSDSWWERDNDSSYYSIREYSLESSDAYSSKGTRPSLTITLERDLSSKLVFRSFLSGSRSTTDISGAVSSSDTTYGDRTYDVWDRLKDRTYFQRRESHSSRESGLDGSGEETTRNWRWFASLIYAPHGHWSAFAGIQLENSTLERTMDETSGYRSHRWEEYTGFKDAEYRNTYSQEKLYSVKMNFEKWTVFLPVGIKVGVVPGLNVILGTDLTLTLTDENSEGRLLYPERITRRWENGTLVVEDIEIDRYEEYTSDPAKNLSRSVQQRFGLVYDHPSGAKLFVRSFGDIFQTTNWALGFEMTF